MGWFDDIGGIFKTITTGGGALGSIARTVAMGYILKKVTASTNKDASKSASSANSGPGAPGIDNGVRLQVEPDPNQKIPILYGSAYFGGIVTDAVMSNNNQRMHYVVTLAEKTGTLYSNSSATSYGIGSIYWDDQTVTFQADGVTVDYTTDRSGNRDPSLNDLVKIYCYAGGSGSANQRFPTGTSGTAVNAYSVVSGWTSAHAMTNLIFAVIEVNYNAEKNIKGLTKNLKFQITSSMNKPGDVLYDYITNGLYGANIANTEIDTTTITALNSYSANSVSYIDENSVSQTLTNRYQINGLVNADNEVMKNVEDIANSSGSWLSYSLLTGKWSVIINRSGTSVASFDDGNILGSISVSGTGLAEMYSSVKVEFPNRDIRDATDYVQINIPIGDRNANELNRILPITYNFINEPVQAQLLGFIELKQKRVDLIITFQSDYTTINMTPGDVIDVTNSTLGFSSKLFRIITVAEVQGDEGLQSEITALEYDSGVYVEDLSRYTRTVTNGFTTTGNIGRPGTPTVAKFEGDARPRIEVSSTSPAGLIEGMEFFLSNDVALGEAQRNYRLIGTRQPLNGNANVRGTFTTGETITLDYDNIGTSNLVVKTRGYNSTTVGPFSSNSAITTFTSTQTTDAIGPDTKAYDELGGLMTALSVVSLLNKLDGLFGGNVSPGSLFEKIFDVFKDETGYDIVGNTANGNLTVSSQLGVKDEGTLLTNAVSTINFTGSGVSATLSNSSQVTVNIPNNISAAGPGGTATVTTTEQIINAAAKYNYYDRLTNARIFPCLFGSGPTIGEYDTRLGIFTHTDMMITSVNSNFSLPSLAPIIKSAGYKRIAVSAQGSVIGPAYFNQSIAGNDTVGGYIDHPARWKWQVVASNGTTTWLKAKQSLSTETTYTPWGIDPGYDGLTANIQSNLNPRWSSTISALSGQNTTGQNAFTGAPYQVVLNLYYSTCSYDNTKSLQDQTWSNWTLLATDRGGKTNPTGGSNSNYSISPSVSLSGQTYNISSNTILFGNNVSFSGNLSCTTYNGYSAKTSDTGSQGEDLLGRIRGNSTDKHTICTINDITFDIELSSNMIIAFGVSCFNLPTGTTFSNNTIFSQQELLSNTNVTTYRFPGYTEVISQSAQVQEKSFLGNVLPSAGTPPFITAPAFGGGFSSSRSNIAVATNTLPAGATVGAVWPDDFQSISNTSVISTSIGIAGCPTVKFKFI